MQEIDHRYRTYYQPEEWQPKKALILRSLSPRVPIAGIAENSNLVGPSDYY